MKSFLRIATVLQRTGLSRSALYAEIAKGSFPRQVSLGARSVAWIESEVEDWIRQRIAASRDNGSRRTHNPEPIHAVR